jgi:hypothetical protein
MFARDILAVRQTSLKQRCEEELFHETDVFLMACEESTTSALKGRERSFDEEY